MDQVEGFQGILDKVKEQPEFLKELISSQSPETLPMPIENLTEFQKLVVLRCFRLDKMIPAVMLFVEKSMGTRFTDPP